MMLDEARKILEGAHTVRQQIGTASEAPTGEPYIVILCGGESEAAAVLLWWYAAIAYSTMKGPGTLYWRVMPELECDGAWRVYSRLLISDKPVLATAAKAA